MIKHETVDASPTKRFFIDNFTRDLTFEDVVLDLIDNSIDSYIRLKKINLSFNSMLDESTKIDKNDLGKISLTITEDKFIIEDNCGGIDVGHAKNDVFRFGRANTSIASSLGIYGIGLKRAIFKIGKKITIYSKTHDNGFQVNIDAVEWLKNEDDWTFPLILQPKANENDEPGTKIKIESINKDISGRIADSIFFKNLSKYISESYSLFLNRYVVVQLNGHQILPSKLPITISDKITPARQVFTEKNVNVELIAGLSDRNYGWNTDNAGWYVICNGRVVLKADKTILTGWGLYGPQYVSKYRGFIGFAFFFSNDPSNLPWTTTKRGLNVESSIYQKSRKEMASISRPIFSFLNDMYSNEGLEEVEERKVVEKLAHVDLKDIRSNPVTPFIADVQKPKISNSVTVQFKTEKSNIERIKKRINKPNYSAGNIGKYVLDYFIKNECSE